MKSIFTLLLLLFCYSINAQLATWNSTAGTSNTTGVSVATASVGSGLLSGGSQNCSNSIISATGIYDSGGADPSPSNQADALADNEYMEFPMTADAGYTITVTSVQFLATRGNNGGTNVSLYDGTSNLTGAGSTIAFDNMTCLTYTLSGFSVTINPGTTKNFRLYIWGADNANGFTSLGGVQFFGIVAPITLSRFDVEKQEKSIALHFETSIERDNSHFDIERSTDGNHFEMIGRVRGAGDSNTPQSYTFEDAKPANGLNYYRLRQVDFDEDFEYSPVRSVMFGQRAEVMIAPQPVQDMLRVSLFENLSSDAQWQIFDLTGRQILNGIQDAETLHLEVNMSALPVGHYVFCMNTATGVVARRFQKQ
ncbi:MAG: T9SS type A sorting domain-containing protein [Saprospiraceae bacterium]|nr:T9SS type A sorting domain-containing protein [Saprospiraceae bacterium]